MLSGRSRLSSPIFFDTFLALFAIAALFSSASGPLPTPDSTNWPDDAPFRLLGLRRQSTGHWAVQTTAIDSLTVRRPEVQNPGVGRTSLPLKALGWPPPRPSQLLVAPGVLCPVAASPQSLAFHLHWLCREPISKQGHIRLPGGRARTYPFEGEVQPTASCSEELTNSRRCKQVNKVIAVLSAARQYRMEQRGLGRGGRGLVPLGRSGKSHQPLS